MRSTQLTDERPWVRPWWQYSEGNGPVFFYILLIHGLALMGLILFPLPSLSVLAVALAIAAIGGDWNLCVLSPQPGSPLVALAPDS
jgi:hypothetical protein